MDRKKTNAFIEKLERKLNIFVEISFYLLSIVILTLAVVNLIIHQVKNENFGFQYVFVTCLLVWILIKTLIHFSVHIIVYKTSGQEQLFRSMREMLKEKYIFFFMVNIMCSLLMYTTKLFRFNNQNLNNWSCFIVMNSLSLIVLLLCF